MTDLDEKLSFLLDDYADANTADSLDEVIGDVNLQYRMRRYQMIGEAMRHELPAAIDTGFSATVMARIGSEAGTAVDKPAEAAHARPQPASILSWAWFKPVAGLAVAASVALVTVVLWQPVQNGATGGGEQLAAGDQNKIDQLVDQVPQAVPVSAKVQPLGMRWKVEGATPGLQQKLNAYLVNHTEYSNSVQGLIPQARVAGFDAQQ